MPYIPFTEEQKITANSVDLAEFLRMRGERLERAGREYKLIYYDSSGKHDSITMSGSRWFDHKNQVGGGAIKFMQYYYNMDFPTAVQELLGQRITPLSHAPPKAVVHEEKPKIFKLPEANENMHRVFAYLIKQRFIASEIITYFAKNHTLYEDKEHHNAVFVGFDEKGIPRQAHKRCARLGRIAVQPFLYRFIRILYHKSCVRKHQAWRNNALSDRRRKSVSVRRSEGLYGRILLMVQASNCHLSDRFFADYHPLSRTADLHSARSVSSGYLSVGNGSSENRSDVRTRYKR